MSELWLTEIMRQRDDKAFAEALKAIGDDDLYGLNDEQVRMFDSRIQANVDRIPRDAIHLFHQNVDRERFNKDRIQHKSPGEPADALFINQAEDRAKGLDAGSWEAQRSLQAVANQENFAEIELPNKIALRRGCRYMITLNDDQKDGLVNGACGILKDFVVENEQQPGNKTRHAIRLWLAFKDKRVGQRRRRTEDSQRKRRKDFKNSKQRYSTTTPSNCHEGNHADDDWVPIERVTKTIRAAKAKRYVIDRVQFALVEAEALTIHKSQGETYECIAFNINQPNLNRALMYVALSRCTKLSGLYLYGRKSILPTHIAKLSLEQRQQIAQRRRETNEWQLELARMKREAPFINRWEYLLQDDDDDNDQANSVFNFEKSYQLNLIFANCRSFRRHRAKIQADRAFKRAQLILLCETRTHPGMPSDQLSLDGYDLVHSSGLEMESSSTGQLVFMRSDLSNRIHLIAINKKDRHTIEMSLFKVYLDQEMNDLIYLLFVYRHPSSSKEVFLSELKSILTNSLECQKPSLFGSSSYKFKNKLYILGDFNLDFCSYKSSKTIQKIMEKYNLNM